MDVEILGVLIARETRDEVAEQTTANSGQYDCFGEHGMKKTIQKTEQNLAEIEKLIHQYLIN
jgi:hypothetical protein